jgi:hypothetical protein
LTQTNCPSKISYTEDDVSRDVQRKKYSKGWYQLLCTTNNPKVSQNTGSLMFQQNWAPLKEQDDPESKSTQAITNYLTLPFANKDIADHKAPNTLGICHALLRAVGGDLGNELPDYPRKIDGSLVFKGDEIAKEDEEEARREVARATRDKLIEIYDEPSVLEGYTAFGYVTIEGDYNKISKFKAELPDDEDLVPPEEWFAKAE